MDFFESCKVVLRRWYVVVPLLLLTFAGTFVAYNSAASHFSAKGSLVLLAPSPDPNARTVDGRPITGCDENPWCGGNNLASLANVAAKSMLDQRIVDRLAIAHPGASYTVALDPDDRSPILDMEVSAPTSRGTLDALRDVRAEVERELKARQSERGVANDALITSSNVTTPLAATVQAGGRTRAALTALGLGLAVTLGGAFLAESIAKSRRREPTLDRVALPDHGPYARDSDADLAPLARPASPGDAAASEAIRSVPTSVVRRRSGRVGS